jgi:DNA-binding NarL/FixJ family response regulator
VAAGQLAVPSSLRSQIAPRALSHREKQILALVVLGLTNRQIADELFLAESTVKTHLSSAFGKLDAHSRADATARILDPESGYGVGILSLGNGAPTPAS